jgi:hypothetical protein
LGAATERVIDLPCAAIAVAITGVVGEVNCHCTRGLGAA